MKQVFALIRRNCQLFFKDKGMFFTSLITPVILLVLYATFLAKVYKDAFAGSMPAGMAVDEALINGTVGGQLISSLLAVCCVTVAFCSNLLMVQDKISGARRDLTMCPVKPSALALGYFAASALSTLLVCYTALAASLLYLAVQGAWYLSVSEVLLLMGDVLLLVLFGTALSSAVNCRLSTNGQASAVGTVVSAGYGFICGAYMPISNFGEGLQRVLSFLPGTYGTALLRRHALGGCYREMSRLGFPDEVITKIQDSVDCNLYFYGRRVSPGVMYGIVIGAVVLLIGVYVLLSRPPKHTHRGKQAGNR